jgi:outer membrane protein OmpA-like peptidoglycan-associated protein
MYQWQPSKWIKFAPVMAGLPFLAGGWLQTDGLVKDVTARVAAAAGDWAKVEFDGRDASVTGQTTQAKLDAAVKAVVDTYGVRTVDFSKVKIAEPITLAAPTIESLTINNGMPEIKGTWPQDVAKTLAVTLNAKTYNLGADAELQSTSGNWTLKPTTAIPVGSYDVTAVVTDGAEASTASAAPGKLVIEAPKVEVPKAETPKPMAIAAAPTVDAIFSNQSAPVVTGTYPTEATKFSVKLAGQTYILGTDKELTGDAGRWKLTPGKFVDGSYQAIATAENADGSSVAASNSVPVVVDTKVPAQAGVTAPAPDAVWPYAISGNWDEGDAIGMSVSFNGKAYALGKDKELVSDGFGKYSFMPSDDLKPGSYDLDFTTVDAANNISSNIVRAAVVIPEPAPAAVPVELTAPTVEATVSDKDMPIVKGTWAAGVAKSLVVSLNGNDYKLGKDYALLSDASGHWTLKSDKALANGTYDVSAIVTDGGDKSMSDSTKDELKVDVPPPPPPPPVLAAPSVEKSTSDNAQPMLMGMWDNKVGKSLKVGVGGTTYELGKDAALTSDANGMWMLTPSAPLANGVYDVAVETADAAGAVAKDSTVGELEVNVPPQPAPEPVKVQMVAPTVETITADSDHPVVKGTWNAGVAKGLEVTLDGNTYKLGTNYELLSNAAGAWTLKPTKPLANGTYDVAAVENDGEGNSMWDATTRELTVAIAPPPAPEPVKVEMVAPTVETSTSDSDHPMVKGTWNAGVAKGLEVTLDGNAYKLGTNYELLSNAAGQWTLKPTKPLVNGVYDVFAVENDGAGTTLADATTGELTVAVAPPPPAPPAAQPYDCLATIARIAAVFPVRFEFNQDDLNDLYGLSVNQYASLLKDPRCMDLKVQVEGHADFIGSEKYNQGLSERRAQTVIDKLKAAGIDAARLTAIGRSKDMPLDPAQTDEARMKNRRVEFTVSK